MSPAGSLRVLFLSLAVATCGWQQARAQVTGALTFLSGSRGLAATHIAAGPDGDVFVAGRVAQFPSHVFVARLSGDLTTLRYLKELGGSDIDDTAGLAVDRDGAAYLAGSTTSTDFPVTAGAWMTRLPKVFGSSFGGFVVKLDPSGEIVYSTFFPQSTLSDLAVDGDGRAVLVGSTRDPSFPVTSDALRPVLRPAACTRFCTANFVVGGLNCFDSPCGDGFLARLLADGSGLDYATFLGADPVDVVEPQDLSREPVNEGDDAATTVKIDSNGHIVVAGMTNATRFPVTPGAYQADLNGDQDVFVMKLDPTGRTVLASTLFGGEGAQLDPKIAVDSNGDIHLGAASFDPALVGLVLYPEGTDSVVAKISGDATRLLYAQPVGAGFGVRYGPPLSPLRVAAAPDGSTLVISPGPFETTPRRVCLESTYVTRLAADDGHVEYSVGQPFFGLEAAVSPDGDLYVAGGSFSTAVSAATDGAYQTEPGGPTTRVVSRVSATPSSSLRVDCVVNAASRGVWPKNFGGIPADPHREDAIVSPGELLTFFGVALGPEEAAVSNANNGVLPLELGGTRIRIGGEPAALLYSQSSQVNAAAAFSLSGSHSLVEVERDGGGSLAFWVPYAHANPGVFTEDFSGRGQAVIVNADGTLNSGANPAAAGSMVSFFVSGLGRTALAETSGVINQEAQSVLPIPGLRVEIGGIEPDTVEVVTAKGLPAGVYAVRCRVPEQLEPGGGHWVTVFVGTNAASQIQASIAVE